MKRKSSQSKTVAKRYKRARFPMYHNINAKGEIKWSSTSITPGTADAYFEVTAITVGGERNTRLGNKIYLRNVAFELYANNLGVDAYKVMVVQAKQGWLASGGSADAPGLTGEVNHDAYRVLYDQMFTYPTPGGDQTTVCQGNVRVNQLIRYKYINTSNVQCDKPIYLWIMSATPVVANIHRGRFQIYWSDV